MSAHPSSLSRLYPICLSNLIMWMFLDWKTQTVTSLTQTQVRLGCEICNHSTFGCIERIAELIQSIRTIKQGGEREHERAAEGHTICSQTDSVFVCVGKSCVLWHEPIDKFLCVLGIGVETNFGNLRRNNEKGKIAEIEHHGPSSYYYYYYYYYTHTHTHTHTQTCAALQHVLLLRPCYGKDAKDRNSIYFIYLFIIPR